MYMLVKIDNCAQLLVAIVQHPQCSNRIIGISGALGNSEFARHVPQYNTRLHVIRVTFCFQQVMP